MGFKRGFLVGFGAGYVLGARAGRQRYEQIRTWVGQVSGSPKVQQAAERTKDIASDTARRGLSAVQEGVEKAGGAVKERLNKDDGSTGGIESVSQTADATGGITTTPI